MRQIGSARQHNNTSECTCSGRFRWLFMKQHRATSNACHCHAQASLAHSLGASIVAEWMMRKLLWRVRLTGNARQHNVNGECSIRSGHEQTFAISVCWPYSMSSNKKQLVKLLHLTHSCMTRRMAEAEADVVREADRLRKAERRQA